MQVYATARVHKDRQATGVMSVAEGADSGPACLVHS
jgi:hypothetical protein